MNFEIASITETLARDCKHLPPTELDKVINSRMRRLKVQQNGLCQVNAKITPAEYESFLRIILTEGLSLCDGIRAAIAEYAATHAERINAVRQRQLEFAETQTQFEAAQRTCQELKRKLDATQSLF